MSLVAMDKEPYLNLSASGFKRRWEKEHRYHETCLYCRQPCSPYKLSEVTNKTMTKADLVKEIHEKNGLSNDESARMVNLVIETLKANLAEGKTVKIAGFGTFTVRKKGERKGRIIRTGEEITIAPRKVVTFKASKQLKAMVERV